MSDEDTRRTGRFGGIVTAVAVCGSAVGVIGWYVMTNRAGPTIDASGFDLSAVAQTRRPAPAAVSAAPAAQPVSSLDMMKGDAGVRIGDSNPNSGSSSSSPGQEAGPAKDGDKKEQAHDDFKDAARKHEAEVRKFAEKMTRQNPVIRQYGKDWMSHPDLKKLNDDYMRNHDPVAFMAGLAKAPSLNVMIKQYAGSPAILKFITQGMKEVPGDLMSSAMGVMSNDSAMKSLVSSVANGLGLPPSITGLINSTGGDMSKIDQKKIISDVTNSAAAGAMQQSQQPPPVSLDQH